ncbi:Uncharacterised protein [Vibrio cholerae]|nr:Uncharacterised protein [Vibrio cholerae]CSI34491.1 Uncharacterised protein [Vibrio cholerae]
MEKALTGRVRKPKSRNVQPKTAQGRAAQARFLAKVIERYIVCQSTWQR